ncbi:MAG TPA: type II secretion system protein [Verrucomicrobiae bacterium]|nr:type II secretion system protein [Verrucomicrobiae bacterium]
MPAKLLKFKRTSEKGDTIVEVLIVLAVLGLAISICYATANRSLLDARQAQENAVASELVQSQIEGLRVTMPSAVPGTAPMIAGQFCVVLNGGSYVVKPYISPTPPDPSCALPFASSSSSISVIYCGTLVRNANCGILSDDTFVVTATWPDVIGGGNDTVSQVYKVHP